QLADIASLPASITQYPESLGFMEGFFRKPPTKEPSNTPVLTKDLYRVVIDGNESFIRGENGIWNQYGADGKTLRFRFHLIGTDANAIYLDDKQRNLQLELNLKEKMSYFSVKHGARNQMSKILNSEAKAPKPKAAVLY
ncbi:MAG: hypothetical protein AAF226_09405, partial [Verrucomicrobiota bacterium]